MTASLGHGQMSHNKPNQPDKSGESGHSGHSSQAGQRGLYPSVACTHTGYLPVGDGHMLYYELSGNPKGVPVVFLHGVQGVARHPCSGGFLIPALSYHSV